MRMSWMERIPVQCILAETLRQVIMPLTSTCTVQVLCNCSTDTTLQSRQVPLYQRIERGAVEHSMQSGMQMLTVSVGVPCPCRRYSVWPSGALSTAS